MSGLLHVLGLWGWGLLTWAASMRNRASASGPEPLRGAGAGATTCRGILAPASIMRRTSLGAKGVRAWHNISRWHTASEARLHFRNGFHALQIGRNGLRPQQNTSHSYHRGAPIEPLGCGSVSHRLP